MASHSAHRRRLAHAVALAAGLCVLLCATAVRGDEACSAEEGPITCEACREGADINAASGLPRVNYGGATVSSNLGEYNWVFCNSTGHCDTWDGKGIEERGAAADSPASYFQSLGVYVGFAVVMAIISPLFFLCCCLLRCCTCCGGWTPTYVVKKNGSRRCFGCGFHRMRNPLLKPEDKFVYPTTQTLLTRVLAIVACILVFTFIGVGQQLGNVAFTDSMQRLAMAPSATVTTIRKLITPGHSLIVDLAGNTLVPTVQDVNATLNDAVDLLVLINATECIVDKAHVPTEFDRLVEMVLDVLGLRETITDMNPEVEGVFYDVRNATEAIRVNTPKLRKLLTDLGTSKTNITSQLTALEAQIALFDHSIDTFQKPSTGVGSVVSDLDDASTSSNYPTSTEIDTAADGGANTPSLQELLSGSSSMVGVESSTPRDQLVTSLGQMATKFGALPNTTRTATNLENLEQLRAVTVTNRTVPVTDAMLANLEAAGALVPGLSTAKPPVDDILACLDRLNTTQFKTLSDFLNATVNRIPNVPEFVSVVDAVFRLADVLPCIDDIVPSILSADEKLMQLPDFVQDIKNLTNSVRDLIKEARSKTDTAEEQLLIVEEKRKQIDFDAVDSLIASVDEQKALANTSFTDLLTESTNVDTTKSFSFGTVRSDLASVQTTLTNPSLVPSQSTLDSLRDAEHARSNMETMLLDVKASIEKFAEGRCSGTVTMCTDDTPCGGGTCLFAQKQCSDTGASCTGAAGDCSPGGYCLFEAQKYTKLRAMLNNYAEPSLGASSLRTQLNNLNTELSALNLDSASNQVTSLKTELDTIDIPSLTDRLNDVEHQRTLVDSNLTDIEDGWAGVRDNVELIPDPDGIKEQLDDMKAKTNELDDIRDKTETFGKLLRELRKFLFETLPPLFDGLHPDLLDARFEADGIEGTYDAVLEVARNLTEFLADEVELFNSAMNSTVSNLTLTSDLDDASDDLRPRLKVLSKDVYFDNGPYYFLANIMDYDNIMDASDPTIDRVFRDVNGDKYPDDKLCVTTGCIRKTVKFVNTQPLGDVLEDFDIDGIPMPLSREQLAGVPFIFPGLACLLLLLSAVCCCPKKLRWQRCSTCCSGTLMLCIIPFAFLLAGIAFVLVMLGGDTCRGGVNAVHQVMTSPEFIEDNCEQLNSPISSVNRNACNVSISDGKYVDINVAEIVSDLFGGCSSDTAEWNTILSKIGDFYVDIPVEEVNKTLNDMDTGGFSPRPRIRTNILDGAQRAGTAASNFIDNVNGVVTCTEINGDVAAYKEAVCCDFMSAAYWAVGAWNLIAWFLCCCGMPACCLGYKRFPRQPWGRHWKKAQDHERARMQVKQQDDAMRMAGGGPAALQMVPVHGVQGNNGTPILAYNDGGMHMQQPPQGALAHARSPSPAWGGQNPMPQTRVNMPPVSKGDSKHRIV